MTDADDELGRTFVLVRNYQQGDKDALNELFQRYSAVLLRMVRTKIGPAQRGRIDVDDVVQETFITAFKNFDNFQMKSPASLRMWLYKIARHRIESAVERGGRKKRDVARERPIAASASQSGAGIDLAASGMLPLDLAEEQELWALMDESVRSLQSEQHRKVIRMRDYALASYAEIKTAMKLNSEAAARVLHQRAREALDKELARRGITRGDSSVGGAG